MMFDFMSGLSSAKCNRASVVLCKHSKLAFTAVLSLALMSCGGTATRSSSVDGSDIQVVASQSESGAVTVQVTAPLSVQAAPSAQVSVAASVGQCNDGIDNDGDGLTDWQYDVGCSGPDDTTEVGLSRDQEDGWTTFNLSSDSRVFFVSSSDGQDSNNGLSPSSAVATLARGLELLRDDTPDFLLLKRGDTWRDEDLYRLKSGRSASERLVVSSYGESKARPRVELSDYFVNDDGRPRSNIAIVGIEMVAYAKDTSDPEYTGSGKAGLRFVGTWGDNNTRGSNLLFEDNFILYGSIVLQNSDNPEIRRNVVYRSYSAGTCAFDGRGNRIAIGGVASRPSGIHAGEVDGMLWEGNVWDSNGWNSDLPVAPGGACATIYNHNAYITDVKNTVIKDDIFLSASSIGLKVSGKDTRGVENLTVENSLFVEGEIGISMAGNGTGPYTHTDTNISNNVFTDIGRTNPTTRNLSWGVWMKNGDSVLYEKNLFVNPAQVTNSFAFKAEGGTQRDVVIRNNLAHGYAGPMLNITEIPGWHSLSIEDNVLVTSSSESSVIRHRGDFSTGSVSYEGNSYFSTDDISRWFSEGTLLGVNSLDEWLVLSGETGSSIASYNPPNEGRNVDSYAQSLGIGSTLADFAREARKQSRLNYREEYSAQAVNDYIRSGYNPGF